ncbi:C39 family peptidase [Marinobacter sp. 71-i]|uniref:C39 family peptidase n=1 Tax=Marinobacter iranensis TaxID=2962607 RepID=A0ABT5YBE4_9GAMM|nr:C39 family peptidase [Marinobacter iranensis]MDF0751012.1 C39 family peptidase [Marinobacter iranensis]
MTVRFICRFYQVAMLIMGVGLTAPLYAASVSVDSNAARFQAPVRSFLELRERNLVRQGWDISCGAAALSTILTYDYNEPYSEATIAVSILANTDPALVRRRGGFSLLDLKRFAEAVGYSANGYGELALEDLADFDAPMILPVRIRGLDHFVVFRGVAAGKVLIGDPAFGNLTLSQHQFRQFWTSGIGFVVEPADASDKRRAALASEAMHLSVPDLNYVYRLSRGAGPVPATRR